MPKAEAPAPLVLLGQVVGAHGVRGAVKIRSFTQEPTDIAAYGPLRDKAGSRSFKLRVLGVARGNVLATVSGVADRDAAEAMRGLELFVARASLPPPDEDEYYLADLVGLSAVRSDGSTFGRVAAVHDFGAGTLLEVEREGAGSLLLPFNRACVPVVDPSAGRVVVEPPESLLSAAAAEDSEPADPPEGA
ncbi:MAG: 16S rRNA processing protein RimM [Alphaproteobacteria bacterium]|nr:16S rRNA processing protein RimM [Alphaproteobacteria bacterium]